MKKKFKDKQFTILWNVDYLKMSHVNPEIISSIIFDIDAEYGNIEKMKK